MSYLIFKIFFCNVQPFSLLINVVEIKLKYQATPSISAKTKRWKMLRVNEFIIVLYSGDAWLNQESHVNYKKYFNSIIKMNNIIDTTFQKE